MFDNSFLAWAFFFFLVEISSRKLTALLRPGLVHSCSATIIQSQVQVLFTIHDTSLSYVGRELEKDEGE